MAQNAESFNQVPFSDLYQPRGESGTVYVVSNGTGSPTPLPPRETWLGVAVSLVGRPHKGSHRPVDGLYETSDGFANMPLSQAIAWANFSHRLLTDMEIGAGSEVTQKSEPAFWLVADSLYYRRSAITRDKNYSWPSSVVLGGALAHNNNGQPQVDMFHAVQFEALKLAPGHSATGHADARMIEREAAKAYSAGLPEGYQTTEEWGAAIPALGLKLRLAPILEMLASPEIVGQSMPGQREDPESINHEQTPGVRRLKIAA